MSGVQKAVFPGILVGIVFLYILTSLIANPDVPVALGEAPTGELAATSTPVPASGDKKPTGVPVKQAAAVATATSRPVVNSQPADRSKGWRRPVSRCVRACASAKPAR